MRDGALRHDVQLARRRAADRDGIVIDVGAAHDDRGVERQILLAAELRAEGVEDARDFVDRAVARRVPEHPRRMRLAPRRSDAPRARAAARHGRIGAVACLERERDVALLRGIDQRTPRVGERLPGMLFIAGEHDGDVEIAQHARLLQRLEGIEDHHVPALHVGAPDRACGRILTHEVRAGGLHDGIEMADQQKPHSPELTAMLGDQMPCPPDGIGHRDPARLEAQRVERRAEHHADFLDAVEVERTARDVDDALQVGDLLFPRPVDASADALLRAIQVRSLEDEKGVNEMHYGTALTVSWARRRSSASRSACFRSLSSRT